MNNFRLWDNRLKELYKSDEITIQIKGQEILACHSSSLHQFTDYVLMQSTGLKDKNGVEIYEGDIVRYNRGISWSVEKFPYVVKNSMEGFVFEYGLIQHSLSKKIEYVTVIGNIYENPELLEDN